MEETPAPVIPLFPTPPAALEPPAKKEKKQKKKKPGRNELTGLGIIKEYGDFIISFK